MEASSKYISVKFSESTLRDRNRELSTLLDISNCLSSATSLQQVLDGALHKTLDHFAFKAGRIYLVEESGQYLALAAHAGVDTHGLERVSINEGFTGKAARTRSFIAQHVTELEDRRRADLLLSHGFEIVICVPLIVMDKLIGVMNLAADESLELDQAKIDLLIVIGTQIAITANHASLFEDLQHKIKEIEEKKDTIEFFAYSATHDLKSPAVGVYGLTQLLFKQYCGVLDERGMSYCRQIMRAAGEIVKLVDRINTYIRTKESPLDVEKVQVEEIIEQVRGEFRFKLEERCIEWVEPDHRIPEVCADRLSIVRIFRNFVDNALKYGGPQLSEIRIGHRENEGFHIFSVSDDGVGISRKDAERLFRPFQRQESAKGIEGTGLGLAIAKEIAEKHGGRVWVEPNVPRGATFCISLPSGR